MRNEVRAAGGLVHRVDGDAVRFAVVHRPVHGDWALPKGKLEKGEGDEEAALREVLEETACAAEIEALIGTITYTLTSGRRKVVTFYAMHARGIRDFAPGTEIDAVEWLDAAALLERLTHADERAIARRALTGRPPCTRGRGSA